MDRITIDIACHSWPQIIPKIILPQTFFQVNSLLWHKWETIATGYMLKSITSLFFANTNKVQEWRWLPHSPTKLKPWFLKSHQLRTFSSTFLLFSVPHDHLFCVKMKLTLALRWSGSVLLSGDKPVCCCLNWYSSALWIFKRCTEARMRSSTWNYLSQNSMTAKSRWKSSWILASGKGSMVSRNERTSHGFSMWCIDPLQPTGTATGSIKNPGRFK